MSNIRRAAAIKQHEALRIPQGWTEQDKALIGQLERILDDIYKRFGRLAWEDLSAVLQEKLATLDNNGHVLSDELPLATSSARGAVQIGYTETGKKYAVQLDSEKMYVNVPWEDTKNSAGTKDKLHTKLYLVGAQTQAANPQTSSNRYVYIGTDDCLYSNDKKVAVAEMTVANVAYDGENKKITKTINGTTSDVVTVSTIKSAFGAFTWGYLAGQ